MARNPAQSVEHTRVTDATRLDLRGDHRIPALLEGVPGTFRLDRAIAVTDRAGNGRESQRARHGQSCHPEQAPEHGAPLTYRFARGRVKPIDRSAVAWWARAAIGIVASLAAAGCGPGQGVAADAITDYLEAVQAQDVRRLYCLVSGAAESGAADESTGRERFREWAAVRYAEYDEGRERGRVELDDQGIVLIKLFALGKGTFFRHGPERSLEGGILVVETDVRFGYEHIDLSGFSPGTTFYLSGAPVGRVQSVRVPESSGEIARDLLESVRVRWTLVLGEPAGSCPAGWTVASVEPVEGSEKTVEVTWIF